MTTHFDYPSLELAHLTVDAVVTNYSDDPQDVVVEGKINGDIRFAKKVHLEGKAIQDVVFTAG